MSFLNAKEARDEALGNLLAVIHGDGGHRALEVGTKQAALEAEKIVANLLSSAPEARDGEAVAWLMHQTNGVHSYACITPCADYYVEEGRFTKEPLYTHPAAPSADKLRIAVEALEKVAYGDGGIGTHRAVTQKALAALEAEGAA